MKTKIKIMPPELASKIAAGEVVERPASVVKELIENSIDAGATDISINVLDAGKGLIKVSDNGCGMSKEDALIAFERHATSKILKEDDLYSISTMGFRGEALPSIASVSDVTLTTKMPEEISGTYIKIKAGKIIDISDIGSRDGTTIEVKNLFFNLPARLKFLRSDAAELGNIKDVVDRLCLANPDIRFRLMNNKAALLDTGKCPDLITRINDVIGRDIAKNLTMIEDGGRDIRVDGFISNSCVTYPSTKSLFVFVNKRWVRDRGINHAIIQGYKNLLMAGRYPFAAVFISIPFEDVDANVHPAKSEVRFKKPRFIYDILTNAVKNALSQKMPVKSAYPSSIENASLAEMVMESCMDYQRAENASHPVLFFGMADKQEGIDFNNLKFIGQLWKEYIICEDECRFYIIDQHAALERIAFERLKNEYCGSGIRSQMLLTPEILEVSLSEKAALNDSMDLIKKGGFDIEGFGGNAFIIKAVPQILSGMRYGDIIKDISDEISSFGKTLVIEDAVNSILIKVACFSVIRGARTLALDEVKSLLKHLSEVDFSTNCPHGRPVVKQFSKIEIETMLKRR